MKVKQLGSGLVIPEQKEEKSRPQIYNFRVNYYSDLLRFLKLVDEVGNLISVVNCKVHGHLFDSYFQITYLSPTEIEMEVLC